MALVHFIDKPNGKKVARLSKHLRAVYDGKRVLLRYDRTRLIQGKKISRKAPYTVEATLKNFLYKAKKIRVVNFTSHTFDQPEICFEFNAVEDGYFGKYGDIEILVSKKGTVQFYRGGASSQIYRGDMEGSIRDLIGSDLWQHTGQSWQKSACYRHSKKEVLELFKKGHVLWNGSPAIITSTT